MNSKILVATCQAQSLTRNEKLLLLVLGTRANASTGQLNPSVSTLEADSGLSRREIFRTRKSLQDRGILSIRNVGLRRNSHMQIHLPKLHALNTGDGVTPVNPEIDSPTGVDLAPVDKEPHDSTGDGVAPVTQELAESTGDEVAPVPDFSGKTTGDGVALTSARVALTGDEVAPVLVPGWHPKWTVEVDSEIEHEIDGASIKTKTSDNNAKTLDEIVGEIRSTQSHSRSRSQATSIDRSDLVGKVEMLLDADPELTRTLFFDQFGRPKASTIYASLASREGGRVHTASPKQTAAIQKIAARWLRSGSSRSAL